MMAGRLQVVGLGMACLDILIRTRQLPSWETGASLSAMGIEGGGPAATAIVAAQRLGIQTGFVGTFGNDRMGRIKLQTMVEEGVDTSQMVMRGEPDNQVVLVTINEENGERVFSSTRHWTQQPLRLDELDRAYITSADILHLDGMHAEAALTAAGWMRALGKPVMLDGSATRAPVSDEMRALVRAADVLICGQGFGHSLTGKSDLWEAGQAVLELGPRLVVQTEGKDGCYTVTPTERFHIPAFEVNVVDTTGAGDVFHGAYLVGLLRGWDSRSIGYFGSAVSALKCMRLGGRPGIPCFDEAIHFLANQGIFLPGC